MRHPRTLAGLAVAFLLGAIARVEASSQADLSDLPSLVGAAEVISEYEVLQKHAEMRADGAIETVYTLSALTPLKGAVPSVHTVRIPGGEVANRGLFIPGLPELATGERAILFLSAEGETRPWRMPVGLSAGAFRVRRDGLGKQQVVRPSATGEESFEVREYETFLREVLDEVARQDG